MKLAKVTTFYPQYLDQFYRLRPGLGDTPYLVQKEALNEDAFGWADYWSHALAPLGYETREITGNAHPLQEAWRVENGYPLMKMELTVLKQLRDFQPDVLFMQDYINFSEDWLKEVRSLCPSIRLVLGWCGAPHSDTSVFKGYDIVLSCIPELVGQFESMGHKSMHMNHAFDPRIFKRIGPQVHKKLPITFIGQILNSPDFHLEREKLLQRLSVELPLSIFSPASGLHWSDGIKSSAKIGLINLGKYLEVLGASKTGMKSIPIIGQHLTTRIKTHKRLHSSLEEKKLPPVFGLKMFRTLRDSVVTMNQHIDISKSSASNMRLFEATGVGTCLLTDWKDNIHRLFEPEVEVVTYRSPEECLEKAKWLIENPDHAAKIGAAGRARVFSEHTFAHRADQLDRLIRKTL